MRNYKITLFVLFANIVAATNILAHSGNFNQHPWVACEEKSLRDACEFYNANEDRFIGTCQSIGDVLMCVRNQPIEYATGSKDSSDHDEDHSH